MFQNKMLNIILIVMIAISLLAIVGILGFLLFGGSSDVQDPEEETTRAVTGTEIQTLTYTTDKITTNLKDRRMIIITLSLLAQDKKAFAELDQRKVQINDIIITSLHSLTSKDFETAEGMDAYKLFLLERVNNVMEQGMVTDIFYLEKVIQ